MRIRDRYKVYLAPVAIGILLSLAATAISLRQLHRAHMARQNSDRIVDAIFELNTIVYEFSRSHVVSRKTWQENSNYLGGLLSAYTPRDAVEKQLMEDARNAHRELARLFDALLHLGVFHEEADPGRERQERKLVTYFLTESQIMVRLAQDLSEIESRRQNQVTRQAIGALLICVAGLVGVIVWSALWLRNVVVTRLEALSRGMQVVADGNLDHRIGMSAPDEFGDLARAFDDMTSRLQTSRVELERSNRELEEYASIASHDLSEPTRMIKSFLQLLQRRIGDDLDDRCREYLHYAVDGADRMQTLIKALLGYAKLSTETQTPQRLDCREIVEHAVANLRVSIAESDAGIEIRPLPQIVGDRTQLIQLFQNLIANAIKFRGDHAPKIVICAEQKKTCWDIQVHDNGIGIAPEHATRIFAVFQRLHAAEDYSGTGIGLAVCRRIVDRHAGTIFVEPGEEQGSVFHVWLPSPAEVDASP